MRSYRRQALARLRTAADVLRRRLQPYRLLIAATIGAIGTVLGTVYEDISSNVRLIAIIAIFVLTALAGVTEPSLTPFGRPASFVPGWVSPAPRRPAQQRVRSWRLRWYRPWAGRVVPSAPPGDALFRGRVRELAELEQRHNVLRAARDRAGSSLVDAVDPSLGTTGPLMLLIHGKPGVGKSALAVELARRLAPAYPHGQIHANLGTANRARPQGDILREFLDALGWPAHKIPAGETERANIFRSLTAKRRMLFVLDAARDPLQVTSVLPADPRCAVIVTSRRDLGPDFDSTSYHLDVPDVDEAITIVRAASNTDDGARPECAVEIVEACGALPLALRAAAERASQGGTELCHVANLLKPAASRLGWLERAGTSVAERLASQYERLLGQEKRALRLLTLVESSTFVPWVLAPLLGVGITEAENIMTRLSAAQMLDDAGSDDVTGLARYRFHPLVRLYAEAERQAHSDDVDEAQSRLDSAYREVVVAVLSQLDSTLPKPTTGQYVRLGANVVERIVANPEPWIRAEYPNMLRQVRLAYVNEPGLCWRLAAHLDGCVAQEQSWQASVAAYDQAILAAKEDAHRVGNIRVLLAKAAFLVAIERYGEGIRALDQAGSDATDLRISNHPDAAEGERLEIVAMRKLGEAHVQMASYRTAAAILREAFDRATAAGDDRARNLIRVLLAEAHQIDGFESAPDDGPERVSDTQRFRAQLVQSDAARRQADWERAHRHLTEAPFINYGDARRTAAVQYRMARLFLDEHLAKRGWPDYTSGQGVDDPNELSLAEQAVRRAAAAAVMFGRMGNSVGRIRAHCLLARALLAAGYLVEAERVAHTAAQELDRRAASLGPAAIPLAARIQRTMGDLLLCRGDPAGGRRLLLQAATTYGWLHDWASETDALRRLREVRWSADGSRAAQGLDDMAGWRLPPDAGRLPGAEEPDEDDPFST